MKLTSDRAHGDFALEEVAKQMAAKDRPIRVRLPLQLWDGKNYQSWTNETWKIEIDSVEEARQLRDTIDLFFSTMAKCGASRVAAALQAEQEIPDDVQRPATQPDDQRQV